MRLQLLPLILLALSGCVVQQPIAPAPQQPAYRPPPPMPPPPPPVVQPPPPPMRGNIVLFMQRGYRGPAARLDRNLPDLRGSGFDDRVRSVQINGGFWELCGGTGFRGRCIKTDRSVPDLGIAGLADRVSSIRRLR